MTRITKCRNSQPAACHAATVDRPPGRPLVARRAAGSAIVRGAASGRGAAWLVILLGLGLVRSAGAWAEDGSAAAAVQAAARAEPGPRSGRSSGTKADAPAETPKAREQRVLAFVREHAPELAAVLAHLARRQPQEYAAALDDLDRTVSKLTGTGTKDPELHAIELEVWKTRTRVEMLVAQLMAGAAKSRASLEARLREAVAAELEAKAAHLAYRRQRSMAWYDRQIDRIREERDEMVETRMKSLLKEQAARKPEPTTGR